LLVSELIDRLIFYENQFGNLPVAVLHGYDAEWGDIEEGVDTRKGKRPFDDLEDGKDYITIC